MEIDGSMYCSELSNGNFKFERSDIVNNYINFEPSKIPLYNNLEKDMVYLFNDGKLLVKLENSKYVIPRKDVIEQSNININYLQSLGAYKGINCYSGEISKAPDYEDYKFVDLRTYSRETTEEDFFVSAKAILLNDYIKKNKRCGICGTPLKEKEDDHKARYCPNCENTLWPQTSPAIIVAVTKGDTLLLAHNTMFPEGMYSIIAGFVELGENFEDCVKREVFEEIGIKVHNINYFGSQPWPFPNSMMIGFTAEYLEGNINVDNKEIIHADWFAKDEVLGKYRKSISISSKLIEWFLNR